MEWLNRLNRAIDYIEKNLLSEVNVNVAAREAASSVFHFQRSFMMLTGVTVYEYVRRRRLTLAAQELALTDGIKVIDVALKYGYETPEAFTKAFSRLHGLPPSQVKQKGVNLKAFPRITFTLSIKGVVAMNYRIVERDSFKLAGKSLKVSCTEGENFRAIPAFWNQCNNDGTSEKICAINPHKPMLGVCMNDFNKEMNTFTYLIAVDPEGKEVQGFETHEVPASAWAVFESRGSMPTAIQDVWNRIYSEWFPATGYEHAGLPEIEVYYEGDTCSKDYFCEVWIPIKAKG